MIRALVNMLLGRREAVYIDVYLPARQRVRLVMGQRSGRRVS